MRGARWWRAWAAPLVGLLGGPGVQANLQLQLDAAGERLLALGDHHADILRVALHLDQAIGERTARGLGDPFEQPVLGQPLVAAGIAFGVF